MSICIQPFHTYQVWEWWERYRQWPEHPYCSIPLGQTTCGQGGWINLLPIKTVPYLFVPIEVNNSCLLHRNIASQAIGPSRSILSSLTGSCSPGFQAEVIPSPAWKLNQGLSAHKPGACPFFFQTLFMEMNASCLVYTVEHWRRHNNFLSISELFSPQNTLFPFPFPIMLMVSPASIVLWVFLMKWQNQWETRLFPVLQLVVPFVTKMENN